MTYSSNVEFYIEKGDEDERRKIAERAREKRVDSYGQALPGETSHRVRTIKINVKGLPYYETAT